MLLTRKILSVMIAAAMMTASLPDVLATETTERDDEPKAIVSETFIDLEDHTMDNLGWISIWADVPMGFEGTVYVEFQKGRKKETAELTANDNFVGGIWLPVGTYTISDLYDPDGMLVGCYEDRELVVTHDQDVLLNVTFEDNPDYVWEEWTGPTVHNSGTLPAPRTEQSTEATSEIPATTEMTTAPTTEVIAETEAEGDSTQPGWASSLIVTGLFALLISIGVFFYLRFRETQTY